MSLLEELAVETSIYVNNKIQEVLVIVEKDVAMLEQKISDSQDATLDYVDEKIIEAKREFVLKTELATQLADINQTITDNYQTLDEKKIDKTESIANLEKLKNELLVITDDLDSRKMDSTLVLKLIDDLNNALTDTINTLGKVLQDQINDLKLTKADKDNVAAEFDIIKANINAETTRATEAELELLNKIDLEISRAKTVEETLNNNIKEETTRATDSELNITNNLNTEISRAKSKEDYLQEQIDENDTQINSDLNDEISRAKTTETDLQNQITENNNTLTFDLKQEEQVRIAGDIALDNELRTQTERIDSMLALSTTDKDSFKEIVEFIETVDLENDTAFAGYVVSNNKAVSDVNKRLDAEIVRAETSEDVIQNQINIETARASKREKEISLDLKDEVQRAIEVEDEIISDLDDEIQRATDEERYLQEQIDDNSNNHKVAELKLEDEIQNEVIRTINSEKVIQNSINAEIVRASKKEKEINTDITEEISRAKLEEADLKDDIDNEISRAKIKEEYLNSLLSQENVRAIKEENYLNSKIDSETTRSKKEELKLQIEIDDLEKSCEKEDNRLNSKIDSEILISRTKENSLRDNINNENTRATEEESKLNDKIDSETLRAITEEEKLQTEIDAKHRLCIAFDDRINSELIIEKSRIDSILTASTSDKDSFIEIVDFINSFNLNDKELLPQIITDINNKIKVVDDKIILETSRAIKAEEEIKKEILKKILDILTSHNGFEHKLDLELNRAKKVELLLENEIETHRIDIKSLKTELNDNSTKLDLKHNALLDDTEIKLEEIKESLLDTDTRFKRLFNDNTKKINEAESKLKANFENTFKTSTEYQKLLENRLANSEIKLGVIDTSTKENIEVLLGKLKNTENKNKEYEERIIFLNNKLENLENADLETEIENTKSIKEFRIFMSTIDKDVKKVHGKVSFFDSWISNKDLDDSEISNNEFNTLNNSIESINEKLEVVEHGLSTLENAVNSIVIPEAKEYDDSIIMDLLNDVSTDVNALTDKDIDLTSQIDTIRTQVNQIIDGSNLDLNSFAEIINYINSIDVNNKDITDLVSLNKTELDSIETQLNNIVSDITDLKTLKTLKTLPVTIENINNDLNSKIEFTQDKVNVLETNFSELNSKISDNIITVNDLDSKLTDYVNAANSNIPTVVEYDDSEVKTLLNEEVKRSSNKEIYLENKIIDEVKKVELSKIELQNNIKDIVDGRIIVANAQDAISLGGKSNNDFLLAEDYIGLAKDGKALNISGNTLSVTNSNGFIETIELPKTTISETSESIPLKTSSNTLRSSQYIQVKNKSKNVWQFMKSITLDAGVYNFNLSTENYINSWRNDYNEVDKFIGQAMILPQSNFDSYGNLTKDNYNEKSYRSKDTNMFNLMDCTQGNYNNFGGQIYLKERQEVRIMIRSVINEDVTFLLKAQLHKTY